MVARKWVRLAQAVIAELGGAADMRSLSQAPDDVLLRASDRCGLLLAAQFPRVESRLAAIRRRLDDAGSSAGSSSDEGNTPRRALEAVAYRDTAGMSPTELRATVEAARTLVGMDRALHRSRDREKRESQNVKRPAEFDVEPTMIARSIMPMPQELAEHENIAERALPTQTSEERWRQQAFAEQARQERQGQRNLAKALAQAAYYRANAARYRDEDTPRRIGMPGLGGM